MKRILFALLMLICIDVGCKAQTHFGFTVGLRPTMQNEINQIVSEEIEYSEENIEKIKSNFYGSWSDLDWS